MQDIAQNEKDTAYYPSRLGDLLLLGLVIVVLLGNGAYIWRQIGASDLHAARAIFFGLALICFAFCTLFYTFKLSVCVRAGPHGLGVERGPWRTELRWSEVARLVERTQPANGRRYRWVVALARDERMLRVREDMVLDYERFRLEVFERYQLWRDHGGTWGTTGGGPFAASEEVGGQARWWLIGAGTLLLPGLYFTLLLPETAPLGPALLAGATLCLGLSGWALIGRRSYAVDAKAIETKRLLRVTRLPWREVTRIDRARHRFNMALELAVAVGQFGLRLAARKDGRVESFDWRPRIPDYLLLRGSGLQIRVRLHRLARPDELLAWVEFYERIGRKSAASEAIRRPVASTTLPREQAPADLSGAAGPRDPFASASVAGESPAPDEDAAQSGVSRPIVGGAVPDSFAASHDGLAVSDDNWLTATRSQPAQDIPSPRATKPNLGQLAGEPPASAPAAQGGPRVTKPVLAGLDGMEPRPATERSAPFTAPPRDERGWRPLEREEARPAAGYDARGVRDDEPPTVPLPAASSAPAFPAPPSPSPAATPRDPWMSRRGGDEREARRAVSSDQGARGRQTPRHGDQPWEPQASAPHHPARAAEPVPAEPSAAYAPEPHPSYEPEWDGAETAEAEADDETPTVSVEGLAAAFAPWQLDEPGQATPQRPVFPRFGPPRPEDEERR